MCLRQGHDFSLAAAAASRGDSTQVLQRPALLDDPPDQAVVHRFFRRQPVIPFDVRQDRRKRFARLARYQFAVCNDYLDWALSHAKAGAQPKPVAELVSQQTELNTAFGDKLRARAEEFTQIAAETHGTVSQWFDDTTAKVADSMKQAA